MFQWLRLKPFFITSDLNTADYYKKTDAGNPLFIV